MKHALLLITLLLAGTQAEAATTVLYDTGWEAAASPPWVAGNVAPQNSWASSGSNPQRIRVVANGSAEATPFASPVTTPYGTQFQRFTASSSTTTNNGQFAWPDLSGAFLGRPEGANLLTGSIDMFVPSGDSADASIYGLFGYDDSPDGNFLDFGFLIAPNTRSILLVLDGSVAANVPGAFVYDTWFKLSIQVDYLTGDVKILKDGTPVPGLADTNPFIVDSSFTDLDFFCQNSLSSPNPRVVFTDNYRVVVDSPADPHPILTIAPAPVSIGDPPAWHISWSGLYFDWILEYTQELNSDPLLTIWTDTGATPANVAAGVASVDLIESPPRTFYRLRQP